MVPYSAYTAIHAESEGRFSKYLYDYINLNSCVYNAVYLCCDFGLSKMF